MKQVPNVTFKVRSRDVDTGEVEWTHLTTADYFDNKKVVVFSLPGAFTPTCSNNQVPGFDVLYDEIIAAGIDEVSCVSCNDAFVMNAWAEDLRVKNVKFIPDGSCEFTAGMDMLVAKDNLGFGRRSWRYAMVVDNGTVEKLFTEPGMIDNCQSDPYGETAPEKVLAYLKFGPRPKG